MTSVPAFRQLGAGAVTRSAEDKLREIVSVLDFIPVNLHAGIAAKTDVTNLTSYIQAASSTRINNFADGLVQITKNSGNVDDATLVVGSVIVSKTVTDAGTTGAQTINKVCGSVNFAPGQSSLVVTCSKATAAASVIVCTLGTNDATAKSAIAIPANGSFTIHLNAACTAETRVNFLVM